MSEQQKDPSVIPRGRYCYQTIHAPDRNGVLKIDGVCPYWSRDPNQPEQLSGCCAFLGLTDAQEDGTLLLWDMVKECSENPDTYGEELMYVDEDGNELWFCSII